VRGFVRDGGTEAGFSFRGPALLAQHGSEVVVGIANVGTHTDRFAEVRLGAAVLSLESEQGAQTVVRIAIINIRLQRTSQKLFRFFEAAKIDQRLAEIALHFGHSRVERERQTKLLLSLLQPLRVEELAEVARMGTSTLHHHFRALTAMSPLQYQKHLRLVAARERMLVEGLDAASAAFEVGYESPSQFSREYKRFFGTPPMQDIKAQRLAGAAAVSG